MFEDIIGTKKDFFGLDIGYNSLKVISLKKRGDNFSLLGANEIPIPPGAIEKNGILHKKEVSDAVIKAIKSAKPRAISAKKVCSALPASLVFTKVIKLPAMNKDELEKAIPYEVADFFPIPIVELNLDWHVLNSIKNPNTKKEEIEVLVIGAPKNLVKDIMEITKNAGVDIFALETKPLSAARAVLTQAEQLVSIVDIGAETTSISLAENGLIKMTVTIKIGGNTITRDIAKDCVINIAEAEKIKISDGLELGKRDAKNLAIIKNLKFITQEINSNIKYFSTRIKKNIKLNEIILTGGGSELIHIDNFIEKELGISTKLANPWLRIKVRPSDKVPPQDSLKYTTALGLAMREL